MPLRPRLLALLIGFVLLTACGGGSSAPKATPTPSATPELTLEQRYKRDVEAAASVKPPPVTGVDALLPDVKEAVMRQPWAKDGFDTNEKQLLEFLIDGAQNFVGVRMDWPYVTRFDRDRLIQVPFDAQREVRIVENGLYEYVQLPKGTVIVVFSSDNDIKRAEVEPLLDLVKVYLPRMEQFLGHEYRTNYLHIQLALADFYPDISLERGSNVFLGWEGKLDAALAFVFVHEMAHSYLTLLPWDSRPWMREGMADLIAAALTGQRVTSYTESATYKPLITGEAPQPGTFQAAYFQESGNGAVFLMEILDLIGYDAMSKVVAGIHQDSQSHTRHANDIFDLMRKNAPSPAKAAQVDQVIEKWTKGVGLVKPEKR